MEIYFAGIGIASLIYFMMILLYNGLTSFLWFWPLSAAVHFFLFGLVRFCKGRKRKKQEIPLRPVVFIFASYGMGIVVLLTTLIMIFSSARTSNEKNLDYVIVLGTELQNNRISNSLRERLDRALQYHEENPGTIFVLSGGHTEYNTSTEAGLMYFYMVQHGVSPKKLLMEVYSKSTQEKVGFSVQTIMTDRREAESNSRSYEKGRGVGDYGRTYWEEKMEDVILAEERPLRVGILTSEFNLFRALRMAKRYGIEDAYPIGTRTDQLMFLHLSVREAVAILKDRLIGNI